MDVAQTLSGLRRFSRHNLGESTHIVRGMARAAALTTHNTLFNRFIFGSRTAIPLAEDERRELSRRMLALFESDWQNVEDGIYPASLAQDFSWWRLLRDYPRLVWDAPKVRRRVRANAYDDMPAEANGYPTYYQRNFHFQTDGYLGLDSAAMYETQVEFLFGGTANVMRRQVLPPVVRALGNRDRAHLKILDVACGTGPVLHMLASALPGARLYGVDLSPHYVAYARQALKDVVPLSLLVENAEQLPFIDGYFDAVTNVFLMHELPPKVRSRVLGEVARVLAPGGVFVLADSIQLGDVPAFARHLEHFPQQFHEPFYRQYLRDDLAGRLLDAGFEIVDTQLHFLTKVVTARRLQA
jgi:ubiquinone/menaquinone biosynthesis C-methylase UbiE